MSDRSDRHYVASTEEPWDSVPRWLRTLGLNPYTTYAALVSFRGERGCFPSQERLAERAMISVRAVRDALRVLADAGAVRIDRNGRANTYVLLGHDRGMVQSWLAEHDRVPAAGAANDETPAGGAGGYRQEVPPNDKKGTRGEARADALAEPVLAELAVPDEHFLPPQQVQGPPARAGNVRNGEVWDALVEVCGWQPVTPVERALFGRAMRDLVAAGASGEEVRRRSRNYWPGLTVTPTALVKHWSLLDRPTNHDSANVGDFGGYIARAAATKAQLSDLQALRELRRDRS